MANNRELGAVHSALHLPEILHIIFTWIQRDTGGFWPLYDKEKDNAVDSYGVDGVLARCALVNKLWYLKAMPILWAFPNSHCGSKPACLTQIFGAIEPPRRQSLANFVREANLVTVDTSDNRDAAIRGIAFPKLQTVTMTLDDYSGVHVPRIENHIIKSLDLDPRFEYYPDTYGMSPDQMESVLDQISIVFPELESLGFIDRAQVQTGALERLVKRLTSLKSFDHELVDETQEDLNFRPEIRAEAAQILDVLQEMIAKLNAPLPNLECTE